MNKYQLKKNFSNSIFIETLLSTNKTFNNDDTFLQTVPTSEINKLINKKDKNDIDEIFNKYNELFKKIKKFLNDFE